MNITLKEYPQFATAHELLKELDGAVIAGGCPRDLLNGKPYSDIDIFVRIYSDQQDLVEKTLKVAKFAHDRNLTIEPKTYYFFGNSIVIRLRIGDNIDVCFMLCIGPAWSNKQPPIHLLDNFDFVCCQAWMERTEEGFIAHSTELFKALNDRKILGFYPDRGDLDSEHAEKILAKYPDYLVLKLVIPKIPKKANDFDCNYDDVIPF
jgi:hypothetical protein